MDKEPDAHIVAQRADHGRGDRAPADPGILLCSGRRGTHYDLDVLLARVHRDLGLEQVEIALDDDTFEELDVAGLVLGERVDCRARGAEEVLEVLLALLEELQPGFVRECRVCAVA